MKSIRWPILLASALVLSSALVLYACAKDTKSNETTATKSTEAAKSAAATPVAIEGAAKPGKAAADLVAPIKTATPLGANKGEMGDHSYSLKVEAPKSVDKGAEAVVRVTVSPKKGWKMNKEFPTRLKVAAPEGVTVAKAKQSVGDAEKFADKGATWAVKFTADSTGAKSFAADFKFAVCTDATCDPKKQQLAWVVNVK